jgi:hypothetical protein
MKHLKKLVQPTITLILAIGFIVLIIQNSKIKNLNSRVETVNKSFQRLVLKDKTLEKDIKFQQFKEDSYLRQLDRDTTLILWFIAIVAGLFGIVSFSSINRRIITLEDDLEKKYGNHLKKVNNLTDDLQDIKADLNSESYTINSEKAENFNKEKNYDLYVFYALLSGSKLSQYYIYHQEKKNIDVAEAALGSIRTMAQHVYERISILPTKPKLDKNSFNILDRNLRKIDDVELNEYLSKIHTLIEFK